MSAGALGISDVVWGGSTSEPIALDDVLDWLPVDSDPSILRSTMSSPQAARLDFRNGR
ncbi:MAG: hypothetical protein OEM40_01180 [Acidimicrobiia bacterium]|nr:hypothetical protein [Acidimicrobiia bacterium]